MFVFVTVGLFVFVVVVDTSDVAAVNMKRKNKFPLVFDSHAIDEVETVMPRWSWVAIR